MLEETSIQEPAKPIISNITAKSVNEPKEIRRNLVKQITGTVRWRESVLEMHRLGVQRFLEIGPGKVLGNLVKRIIKGADQFSLGTAEELHVYKEQNNV